MLESNRSFRVDEDIATQLVHVRRGHVGASSTYQQFETDPPCGWAPYVPPMSVSHSVSAVQIERLVYQNRPVETCFAGVGVDLGAAFKRHDCDRNIQQRQLVRVLSQLRQVLTARQSTKVPVKYQQQPATGIVLKPVFAPGNVGKLETDGAFSGFRFHSLTSTSFPHELRCFVLNLG
jgi:hypothetical protein